MISANISPASLIPLYLRMEFDGQEIAKGTGFLVSNYQGVFLITARHNFTGRCQSDGSLISKSAAIPNAVLIRHNAVNGPGEWVEVREQLYDATGRPRWFEHPILGEKADFVALPVSIGSRSTVMNIPLVTPGLSSWLQSPDDWTTLFRTAEQSGLNIPLAVRIAEPVSVVGYPFGLSGAGSLAVWATGFLASEPALDYQDLPMFLIDCRSRPGQSGSPVFAQRSGSVQMENGVSVLVKNPIRRFLGVYCGRINKDSDIGMVWKASAIEELAASIRTD